MMGRTKLRVDGRLCILLALMLLLLPLPWVLAAMLAAGFHELCHAIAIRLLDGEIYALRLEAGGIKMDTSALSPGREILAALAGPVGSGMLVIFAPQIPRIAVCGAVHCLFNLIPLYPLDGGRILRNLCALRWPQERQEAVFGKWERIFRSILGIVSIAMGLRWGWIPVIGGFLVLMRQWMRRTV